MEFHRNFQIFRSVSKNAVKFNNYQDLERLCKHNCTILGEFIEEIKNGNPFGLWQEIKSLPKESKKLFDKHILNAFEESVDLLSNAIATHNGGKIIQSLSKASSKIFTAFTCFFDELAKGMPLLLDVTEKAIKMVLVYTVFIYAPFLVQLMEDIEVNLYSFNVIIEEILEDIKKIDSALVKIMLEPSLSNLPEFAQNIFDVAQRYHVPIENLLSFLLTQEQLFALEYAKESVSQVQSFINGVCEVKDYIPFTSNAAEHFITQAKKDLHKNVIDTLNDIELRNKASLLFEKTIGSAFEEFKDSIKSECNIFQKVAAFSSMAKKFNTENNKFLAEISNYPNLNVSSQKYLKDRLQEFIGHRLSAPIEKFQTAMNVAKDLSKNMGLAKATEYLIQQQSSERNLSK